MQRRAGHAKRFLDDLQAPSSLHADVWVYVAVRPDRSSCGNEDETLIADGPAKADGRLQRRARADVLPHALQPMRRTPPAPLKAGVSIAAARMLAPDEHGSSRRTGLGSA